jgi:hypothetical protein
MEFIAIANHACLDGCWCRNAIPCSGCRPNDSNTEVVAEVESVSAASNRGVPGIKGSKRNTSGASNGRASVSADDFVELVTVAGHAGLDRTVQ